MENDEGLPQNSSRRHFLTGAGAAAVIASLAGASIKKPASPGLSEEESAHISRVATRLVQHDYIMREIPPGDVPLSGEAIETIPQVIGNYLTRRTWNREDQPQAIADTKKLMPDSGLDIDDVIRRYEEYVGQITQKGVTPAQADSISADYPGRRSLGLEDRTSMSMRERVEHQGPKGSFRST